MPLRLSGQTIFALAQAMLLCVAGCASTPPQIEQSQVAENPGPQQPVYRLAQIEKANGQTLDAIFGPPALTRREGAGEFRRYALNGCMIIVILYPDGNDTPRVANVSATPLAATDPAPDIDQCLAAG